MIVQVPLYQNNDRDNANNYGRNSLILGLAEVFEEILHKRFTSFLAARKIISENQYKFLKNLSTNDVSFATISKYIYEFLDSSSPPLAIFLDLACLLTLWISDYC